MSENENSARPRCDFIYTKNSARPRSDFIYTKNFQEGRCDRKWRFYNKETAFAGYKISRPATGSFRFANVALCYFSAKDTLFFSPTTFSIHFRISPTTDGGAWSGPTIKSHCASIQANMLAKLKFPSQRQPSFFCAAKKTSRRGKKPRWSWFFTYSIHRFFFLLGSKD